MGYMGFGLQRWIYNQQPRKPFSRKRKQFGSDGAPRRESGEKVSGSFPGNKKDYEEATNVYKLKNINFVRLFVAIIITAAIIAGIIWGANKLLEKHYLENKKELTTAAINSKYHL